MHKGRKKKRLMINLLLNQRSEFLTLWLWFETNYMQRIRTKW